MNNKKNKKRVHLRTCFLRLIEQHLIGQIYIIHSNQTSFISLLDSKNCLKLKR